MELKNLFFDLLSHTTYTHTPWNRSDLVNRNWRSFEELTSILWKDMGYETKLVRGKKDGGVDVIAEETNQIPLSGSTTFAIQVKNKMSQKISESEVRDLYGVENGGHRYSNTSAFDGSIFVTSRGCLSGREGFTNEARQFAEGNGVELINGEKMLSLLNSSSLSPLSLGRKQGNKWHLRNEPRCGWSRRFSQNQTFAEIEENIFNTQAQEIETTEVHASIASENICEACMNRRRYEQGDKRTFY